MGFRIALKRIWRFLRPQWKAMTDREIEELDRAVNASMATGTFGLHRPAAATTKTNNMTGDRLWSLGSSQQTRASRVSEAPSRSGYGGRPVSAAAAAAAAEGHRVVSGRQQRQEQQQGQAEGSGAAHA